MTLSKIKLVYRYKKETSLSVFGGWNFIPWNHQKISALKDRFSLNQYTILKSGYKLSQETKNDFAVQLKCIQVSLMDF